jgi:glycosyltransferase involved in cell wall biosynthesis
VLLPFTTEGLFGAIQNKFAVGEHEGVAFCYTTGATRRPRPRWARAVLDLVGIVRLWWTLTRRASRGDAVLVVSDAPSVILASFAAARAGHLSLVQEKTEYPFYHSPSPRGLRRLYQQAYVRTVYRLFDSMFVISEPLREHFSHLVRRACPVVLLPPLVDPAEFADSIAIDPGRKPYLLLCGKLIQSQDGVLDLLRAFDIVRRTHADIRLVLAGAREGSKEGEIICRTAHELGLANKVDFVGYVPRDRLVTLMRAAQLLVLAKPPGLQSDYCFPSKLAEYLATGKPTVVTRTGPIMAYVEDRVHAFLCAPGSVDSLAETIGWALDHPDVAARIGAAGRDLAQRQFDYRAQGPRLAGFLLALRTKRLGGHP